ncbi:MAG TPA: KUP/HAK/KT family potassium transporter, partial [Gemmatimonadaceae bacterium]
SVLSAIEGLKIATPRFEPYLVPIAIAILIGLFTVQKHGAHKVGKIFGPIMLVWFAALTAVGLAAIMRHLEVLYALDPRYGARFMLHNGMEGFLALSAVVLAVTGTEALYADIGHFGASPVRLAWSTLVFPALLFNYLGQGAILLEDPAAVRNPFYGLLPQWGLYPMVALATAATIIASQAVITGAFSLTRQAVHFDYSPRLEIRHTSPDELGQVYVPAVNWAMMAGTIGLVVAFRSSQHLAAAYGVAVTTTMVITSCIYCFVARDLWRWRPLAIGGLAVLFLAVDAAFFGSSMTKIPHGGWFPLILAASIYYLMSTWRRGREALAEEIRAEILPLDQFFDAIEQHPPARVQGTALYMSRNPDGVPPALSRNIKHNKVLHERTLLVTFTTVEAPRVPADRRLDVQPLGHGLYRVVVRHGFMESPDMRSVFSLLNQRGMEVNPADVTIFVGTERVAPASRRFDTCLFSLMARNAQKATDFFRLPPDRVIELGAQVELPLHH